MKSLPPADCEALLADAAKRAVRYLEMLDRRSVVPTSAAVQRLAELGGPLPAGPTDAQEVLRLLDEIGSPATVASAGSRYFGLVIGGSLPVSVAANWLATAWDQNAAFRSVSPVAAVVEDIVLSWLAQVLHLPGDAGGALVSGGTMASFAGLAAARHALLERAGWDVEAKGLAGAPPLRVVVSEEVHATVLKALALLGLGRELAIRVPTDGQGRMRSDALPPLDARTIVCIQAGNVNTGAFDPARRICAAARAAGAWVHVDGAFGLWAAASPERRGLLDGVGEADSWATDAHKWLNVPYDCGLAFVRDATSLRAAMRVSAAYLTDAEGGREPSHYTPELSRRARGVDVWAALRSLGRSGLGEMIEGCCRHAARLGEGLRSAGFEILNDVVLNQVLVSFGEPEVTRRVVAAVQEEGTCWCAGTLWQGRTAMRISISGWATTNEDIDRVLAAMVRVAKQVALEHPA